MLVAAALVVLLTAVLLLAATAVAYIACRGQRGDAATEPLQRVGAALAFLREWVATLALIGTAPFRLRARTHDPSLHGAAIFVPERHCSSAGFWYLRRRLRTAGWASLPGLERRDTADTAATATAALDARVAALPPGTDVVLIGHGIGGLVARTYAAARPQLPVRHVITLGTPHQGSRALPYSLLGGVRPSPAPACKVDVIAICSDFDAWLVPIDDAYCPQAFNIAVRGVGHCTMLLSRRVADLITENLAAPRPRKGGTA